MVAEKPSLAKSLAEILSHKRCDRRKSICNACDVYEFKGTFPAVSDARFGSKGVEAHFKMTSVCGHVMGLDFLPKYNKWDSVDPVSPINFCKLCNGQLQDDIRPIKHHAMSIRLTLSIQVIYPSHFSCFFVVFSDCVRQYKQLFLFV